MITKQLNMGDTVWVAYATLGKESTVPCPVCFGQKAVTINLGDGSQVQVDCDYCGHGFRSPTGTEKVYAPEAGASIGRITGMELRGYTQEMEYRVDGSPRRADELFETKADALVVANALMAEALDREMQRRAARVEDAHRSMTWKIGYHRREAAKAASSLAYHEGEVRALKARRGGIEDEPEAPARRSTSDD